MKTLPIRVVAVGAACAVAGASAGAVLSASAAPTTAKKAHAAKHKKKRSPLMRAVHAELTVPTKTGFGTVTVDRGFVRAVDGDQLTISESTKKLTGKTVTLTVPASTKVHLDGKDASLKDLKLGQHAALTVGPKRAVLNARTPK